MVEKHLFLGLVLLVVVPALVLMMHMALTIPGFSFHSIPDYARQGNRVARWYMRIVLTGFAAAVAAFFWALSQR